MERNDLKGGQVESEQVTVEHQSDQANSTGRFTVVLFDHFTSDSGPVKGKGYKRVENAFRKATKLNNQPHSSSESYLVVSPDGQFVKG